MAKMFSVESWFEDFGLKNEYESFTERSGSPVQFDSFEELLNDIPGDTKPFADENCTIRMALKGVTRRDLVPISEQEFRRVFTFDSPAEDKYGMLKFQMNEAPKSVPNGRPSLSATPSTAEHNKYKQQPRIPKHSLKIKVPSSSSSSTGSNKRKRAKTGNGKG
eukprot:m.130679 g.130679  ORF g.130679 m.130679 type:complete len:163 (-) comp9471_c0_seq3:1457-1945(-)